jgi:hypothetical protein
MTKHQTDDQRKDGADVDPAPIWDAGTKRLQCGEGLAPRNPHPFPMTQRI